MSKIKPVPTPEVIRKTLEEFREKLSEAGDPEKIENACKEAVETLTPAREIRLLLCNDEGSLLTECSGKEHPLDPRKRSLIGKALQSQKALYTNDVRREAEYLPSLDNPFDYPLKSLLLAPLLHPESSQVIAILWAAIPRGDLHQFVREDLEALEKLLGLISSRHLSVLGTHTPRESREFFQSAESEAAPSDEDLPPTPRSDNDAPKEAHSDISSRTAADESYEPAPSSVGMKSPAIIRLIRSLLQSNKK